MLRRMKRNGTIHTSLMAMKNVLATLEHSGTVSYKGKTTTTIDLAIALGIHPRYMKIHVHTKIYIWIIISALCKIAKTENNPSQPRPTFLHTSEWTFFSLAVSLAFQFSLFALFTSVSTCNHFLPHEWSGRGASLCKFLYMQQETLNDPTFTNLYWMSSDFWKWIGNKCFVHFWIQSTLSFTSTQALNIFCDLQEHIGKPICLFLLI